jgi:thiol-disulfide isomerase/thioredoxin
MRFAMGIFLGSLVLGCGSTDGKPAATSLDKSELPVGENAVAEKGTITPEPAALPPAPEPEKEIYAKSFINKPAPAFVVEEWMTEDPSREGKMVLIDFWATWCGPCIKAIPELNQYHRQHKDRLAVIGVSDETSEEIREYKGPKINYAIALDPQKRMSNELEITGIPHLILVDPTGVVRWQGYPFEPGHEFTEAVLDELLDTYVP